MFLLAVLQFFWPVGGGVGVVGLSLSGDWRWLVSWSTLMKVERFIGS